MNMRGRTSCSAVDARLFGVNLATRVQNLMENAAKIGGYLMGKLKNTEGIKELRGLGLMIGIETRAPQSEIRNALLKKHKIFTGASAAENTIRILPSLALKKEEADIFLKAFNEVMSNVTVKVK